MSSLFGLFLFGFFKTWILNDIYCNTNLEKERVRDDDKKLKKKNTSRETYHSGFLITRLILLDLFRILDSDNDEKDVVHSLFSLQLGVLSPFDVKMTWLKSNS